MNRQKGITQIAVMVVMLVLAVALPLTTKLVQQNQETRSNAATATCTQSCFSPYTTGQTSCSGFNTATATYSGPGLTGYTCGNTTALCCTKTTVAVKEVQCSSRCSNNFGCTRTNSYIGLIDCDHPKTTPSYSKDTSCPRLSSGDNSNCDFVPPPLKYRRISCNTSTGDYTCTGGTDETYTYSDLSSCVNSDVCDKTPITCASLGSNAVCVTNSLCKSGYAFASTNGDGYFSDCGTGKTCCDKSGVISTGTGGTTKTCTQSCFSPYTTGQASCSGFNTTTATYTGPGLTGNTCGNTTDLCCTKTNVVVPTYSKPTVSNFLVVQTTNEMAIDIGVICSNCHHVGYWVDGTYKGLLSKVNTGGFLIEKVSATAGSHAIKYVACTIDSSGMGNDCPEGARDEASKTVVINSIPACTESNWTSTVSPLICPSTKQQTKTWTKTGTCTGGVTHPTTEVVACVVPETIVDCTPTTNGDPNGCSANYGCTRITANYKGIVDCRHPITSGDGAVKYEFDYKCQPIADSILTKLGASGSNDPCKCVANTKKCSNNVLYNCNSSQIGWAVVDCGGLGCNATTNTCNTAVVACTDANWTSTLTPSTCPSNGQQTKNWTKVGTCTGGVNHSATEVVSCTYNQPIVLSKCKQCRLNASSSNGNLLCKSKIIGTDISAWVGEYDVLNPSKTSTTFNADLDCDDKVTINDLSIIITKILEGLQ